MPLQPVPDAPILQITFALGYPLDFPGAGYIFVRITLATFLAGTLGRAENPLSVISRKLENATILDLKGRLGLGEAIESFRDNFHEVLEGGEKNIVVNLSGVPFIDSSGIGALVGAFTMAESKGAKCVFYAPSTQVKHALEISRLNDILNPFNDESAALASLAG